MEWIMNNWILLLIAVLVIGLNFFGYGCCGHRKNNEDSEGGPEYHKGDSDSCSVDEGTTKKGGGCCH